MTWFSLRSGMASTGVRKTERTAQPTINTVAQATKYLFRRDHSMMRLITRKAPNPKHLVCCLRNNYTFAGMDFGRRLGASDEHIPKWICEERATTPPPKRHAALRVALKLAWGFVAQSVEYRWGYTPSFAPRPRPI